MKIIKYGSDEEDIVGRLLTALVSQWDELPPVVQDLLLRKACLGFSRHLPRLRFESGSKFSSQSTAPLPGRMRNAPRCPFRKFHPAQIRLVR
jgi:hypothetical protein